MQLGPLDRHHVVDRHDARAGQAARKEVMRAMEDIDALEDRSAIGDMGQYVALRQIRQTTAKIESGPVG